MRLIAIAAVLCGTLCSGGCGWMKYFKSNDQPYMTPDRMERGLVMVFTGIEGRSSYNEGIVDGLAKGGVGYAIETEDWTASISLLYNLEAKDRNHRKAAEYARQIIQYRETYPGRPVILVGQSGGGAIAVWVAEAMQGEDVDGVVLLAATLSPQYRLDVALSKSARGIVNFYSERDVFMLGLGTKIFRTMDGKFTSSAGRMGFEAPGKARGYKRLYQVPWNSQMASGTGNTGGHLSSGSEEFVARYVAPLVMAAQWDSHLISRFVHGEDLNSEPGAERDDLRARVR